MRPLAAIPVRSLEGMSRLGDRLDAYQRSKLTQALILRTAAACAGAGAGVAVVTADAAVSTWAADHDIEVLVDPGRDLDAAAQTAVAAARGRTWLVVHGDLPLLTHRDVTAVLTRCGPVPVLAPSHDGGTSVVAATADSFPFRYGPGSFQRHLAAVAGGAAVVTRPGLALDLDRSSDLDMATLLGGLHAGQPP
jgi:2-phospho-L-lactate guanylyltransferase